MAPDPFDLADLNSPYQDPAHERLRVAVLDHFEQLADSFLLGQTAADMAQTFLLAVLPLQQAAQALQQQVAALTSRVAALESPTTLTAPPTETTR